MVSRLRKATLGTGPLRTFNVQSITPVEMARYYIRLDGFWRRYPHQTFDER
jgi:hypothetical protein